MKKFDWKCTENFLKLKSILTDNPSFIPADANKYLSITNVIYCPLRETFTKNYQFLLKAAPTIQCTLKYYFTTDF